MLQIQTLTIENNNLKATNTHYEKRIKELVNEVITLRKQVKNYDRTKGQQFINNSCLKLICIYLLKLFLAIL